MGLLYRDKAPGFSGSHCEVRLFENPLSISNRDSKQTPSNSGKDFFRGHVDIIRADLEAQPDA
ncbi:hypothetical protein GCM10008938_38370 [Deinococcus roseus]|uniref:Uncharacterized protein n=1 Tax=Deinococcus roseus TaxID=392414 RepID=A0ABQ2D7I6_9DEIO|nr:hypothetical protein GCM10008938_38370 [Deinococcus roseus]